MVVELVDSRVVRTLRHRVLRPGRPASESEYPDDDDPRVAHVAVMSGTDPGQVVAVGSVLPEAPPGSPGAATAGVSGAWPRAPTPAARGSGLWSCAPWSTTSPRKGVGLCGATPGSPPKGSTGAPGSRPGVRSSNCASSAPTCRCGGPSPVPGRLCQGRALPRRAPKELADMPEAVIVATGRNAHRTRQQGLAGDLPARRPDRPRNPRGPRQGAAARPRRGRGRHASAAGSPPARPGTTWPGWPPCWPGSAVPGVTVNRYCSSSLQTIRMAAHAIKAGEGDVFVAGRCRDREPLPVRRVGHRPPQPGLRRRRGPHRGPRRRGHRAVDAPDGPPRRLHRHGPDRRERGRVREGHPPGDGRVRGAQPEPGGGVPEERVLRARDHPRDPGRRHRGDQGRRAPPRHHRRGALRRSSRCSARGGRSPPATPAP